MSEAPALPLIAVDIGNTRMKLGRFDRLIGSSPSRSGLPEPAATLDVASASGDLSAIDAWLWPAAADDLTWWIGSVNRPATTRLLDWLRDRPRPARTVLLAAGDLPLAVSVPRPDMVGIDRLISAVGANVLRPPDHGAIVVDLGTAITVDRISPDGTFRGGAILPGIGTSARALHEFTDLLPLIPMAELAEAPAALGTNTIEAMRSGLFWGAVGGVRELIVRLGADDATPPAVYLTGGAAPTVAALLSTKGAYVPHLNLGGIALAAHG